MKNIVLFTILGMLMFVIPFKMHAFKSNEKSNIEKLNIDWFSFTCYGGALKEKKIRSSVIHFNNRQGLALSEKDYTLNTFFTKKVSLAPSLSGRHSIILPLAENAYADLYLYDEDIFASDEKRYIRFDTCFFYESSNYRNYVLLSSDGENRLDLYTDLKGNLTEVSIVVSVKKGGLQNYMKVVRDL
jgi:hypothetical protein